jgi:hypothetical protein
MLSNRLKVKYLSCVPLASIWRDNRDRLTYLFHTLFTYTERTELKHMRRSFYNAVSSFEWYSRKTLWRQLLYFIEHSERPKAQTIIILIKIACR